MEPEFWKVSQAERATRMADLRKNGMTVEPAAKEVLDRMRAATLTCYRIGVDIGGTFTYFALLDERSGIVTVHMRLTTPADPSEGVLDGIDRLLEKAQVPIAEMRGMTLLPNAVLERKSARIGCWSRAAFATCSKSAWSDATTCSTCA